MSFHLCKEVEIKLVSAGYGKPGLGGQLGYEDKVVSVPQGEACLSIHAPGHLAFKCSAPVKFRVAMAPSGGSRESVLVYYDGSHAGSVQLAGSGTDWISAGVGLHKVNLRCRDNALAHTIVYFNKPAIAEDPQDFPDPDIKKILGIEILSNTECARGCPGCNQRYFMSAWPEYHFSVANATQLVKSLERESIYANLFFSGGEPGLWEGMPKVMEIINRSKNVLYTQVCTSIYNEKNMLRLKKYFDRVFFSRRSETPTETVSDPEWMNHVGVWDAEWHSVGGPAAERTNCCCAFQGVECAIIENNILACTCAEDLRIQKKWVDKWDDLKISEIALAWQRYHDRAMIGKYQSCRNCANNSEWRKTATKERTKGENMKNFDDKFEVLKTILIFTIVICLVTSLMVLIWLYGCQPGAVQGAESTKYFNAKMIEVSKKKIRSRRPVKRRSNPKQETVLITSVPTFNPTVYHQYWVPSVMIEQKWELEKKEDDVNKKNACSPADSGDSIGSGSQTIAKERMLLQKLPLAPVKFKSKAVWK